MMASVTAHAAVLPVTSCADDGSAGTLRAVAAIAAEGDVLDLGALTCGTLTLTDGAVDISLFGPNQLYDLTIRGPGRDLLTIEAAGASQIFNHGSNSSDGTLVIEDLTIANGSDTHGMAGCISSFASVSLIRSTVSNCESRGGYPVGFGGAVSASAYLNMVSSTITGSLSQAANNGSALGGGAYVGYSATLVDSIISNNRAVVGTVGSRSDRTGGGGIYAKGGLNLTNSSISGNSVEAGGIGRGGGALIRGSVSIVGSTIDDNHADGSGGGLNKANYTNYGDNITKLTVRNSTFSGNSAKLGGGIATHRPTELDNSTIAFNEASAGAGGIAFELDGGASTLQMRSSIVADNSSVVGAQDMAVDGTLTVTGSHNLVLDTGIAMPADTLVVSAGLLALADNGGATRTHALEATSAALDAGDNPLDLATDQRGDGFERVVGTAVDIGAFESAGAPDDRIFADDFDGEVESSVVVSGPLDWDVPNDFDGLAIDLVTGAHGPFDYDAPAMDINLLKEGGGLGVYWYDDRTPLAVGGVADINGDYAMLLSGTVIGPGSTWNNAVIKMNNWQAGGTGYIGIAFANEQTGALNYGYIHLQTTAPNGYPATVLGYAYDSSGAPITIP